MYWLTYPSRSWLYLLFVCPSFFLFIFFHQHVYWISCTSRSVLFLLLSAYVLDITYCYSSGKEDVRAFLNLFLANLAYTILCHLKLNLIRVLDFETIHYSVPENERVGHFVVHVLSSTAETLTDMNINLYISGEFQNYKHITHERAT